MKRDHLKENEVFYYAAVPRRYEFTVSWLPTLYNMWSPVGQQIMIHTPWVKRKRFGIGVVNYHSGETVGKVEKRKQRQEIAPILHMLLDKHPEKVVDVDWDNVNTHYGVEIEQVVEQAQSYHWDSKAIVLRLVAQLGNDSQVASLTGISERTKYDWIGDWTAPRWNKKRRGPCKPARPRWWIRSH